MTAFALHPRLAADTIPVATLDLSELRLMNDRRWPWLLLVPARKDAVEISELAREDRALLIEEIAQASEVLKGLTGAAKINVGALGNIVSQLHVHVVARGEGDAAWPGPVWGAGTPEPYSPEDAEALVSQIATAMARR